MFEVIRCSVAITILAVGAAMLPPRVQADTVHMKNGKTLIGVIDDESSNATQIMIRTSMGTRPIPRSRIESIERQSDAGYTEVNADLALSEGDLDKALELYIKAISNDPSNERLKQKRDETTGKIRTRDEKLHGEKFRQVQALIDAGSLDEAVATAQLLRETVKEDSAKARTDQLISSAYVGLARQQKDRINYGGAEQYYRQAMEVDPENAVAVLELADITQELTAASLSLAIPLYQKGIALAKKHAGQIGVNELLSYRFKLGRLYMNDKKYLEAARLFLEVSREDKNYDHPAAITYAIEAFDKAQIVLLTEGIDEIINDLKSIVDLKPNEDSVYYLLGAIYYNKADWQATKGYLQSSLANASPATPALRKQDALFKLGICLVHLGELEPASNVFTQVLRAQPNNYDALCELGSIRMEQSRYEEAIELFEQAKAQSEEKYRAYLGAGYAYQKLARFQEARINFKEVVKLAPDNTEASMALGHSYFDEERWSDAISEIENVIRAIRSKGGLTLAAADRTKLAEGYTLMGDSNLNLNNNNRARENYEEALGYISNYAQAYDGIGKTWQNEKRHKDAQSYFLRAIRADPGDPRSYLSMALNLHKFTQNYPEALKYYYMYLKKGGSDPSVNRFIEEIGGTAPINGQAPDNIDLSDLTSATLLNDNLSSGSLDVDDAESPASLAFGLLGEGSLLSATPAQ